MKKSSVLLSILLVFGVKAYTQEEMKIKVGGFVRYEAYYDTYESVVSRDGVLYLYPKAADLDTNGKDLNENGTLNMLSVVSRFNIKATGPVIFGAQSSSLIEADFYGTAQDYTRLLRLRHAYVKLDWTKSSLMMGHYFHPMFVTQCYPGVLTFAVAVPFNPLNRSSQIRYTIKPAESLSLTGAALMHTYHRSIGPIDAQRDAGVPDMQFQFQFAPGNLLIGGTAGYKVLQPRLVTDAGLKTDESIGSYNLQGFMKYSSDYFSIKAMGVYGENLTSFVSIGGYGAAADPTLVDDYSYSNMKTYSVWTDVTVLKNPQIGLFVGYAENLGADGDYFKVGYGRSENLAKTLRVSPRVTYKASNLTYGFEVLYATATYGETFDSHYKAITYQDATSNLRLIFTAVYSF